MTKGVSGVREIKFRGKCPLLGNEWVYGGVLISPDGAFILRIENTSEEMVKGESCPVDPATVGQYTGLHDSKGQEIYEGDVVRCTARMDEATMIVIFENGEFRMILCDNTQDREGRGYYAISCFDKQVVGTIHDERGER